MQVQEAEKPWRRIRGHERIAELIGGVVFKDGEAVKDGEQEQEQQRFAARSAMSNLSHTGVTGLPRIGSTACSMRRDRVRRI